MEKMEHESTASRDLHQNVFKIEIFMEESDTVCSKAVCDQDLTHSKEMRLRSQMSQVTMEESH